MVKKIPSAQGALRNSSISDDALKDITEALYLADELATAVIRGDSRGQVARALSVIRAIADVARIHKIKVS